MALLHSIAGPLRRWRNRFFASKFHADPRHELGWTGENVAARYLRTQGFKVLYRNFRARGGGEVDIVCRDKTCDTLVFVEVKTRRSIEYGTPAEAVGPHKQRLISRGALAWMRLLDNPDILIRFDIVEVLVEDDKTTCHLIRNAFPLPEPYIY